MRLLPAQLLPAPSVLAHDISEAPSSSSSSNSLSLSRPQSHDAEPGPSYTRADDRSPSRGRTRDNAARREPGSASQSRTPSILRASSAVPHSPFIAGYGFGHYQTSPMSSSSPSANNNVFSKTQQNGHNSDHASHPPLRERHSRFSLAGVSNALLDAVKERIRSNSPSHRGKERARTPVSRDRSPEASRSSRTRSMMRDSSVDPDWNRGRSRARDGSAAKDKAKEKSAFGRLGGALRFDADGKHDDSWKEFRKGKAIIHGFPCVFSDRLLRKGSYTYPISFAIPGDSPPSLSTEFGAVTYRLKATVHRPGTFTHKLTTSREVVLIASPGEDDLEESDNITVQREWDSQMHYAIIISGRAFAIGSSIPLHVTFMPISKMKIYRISAIVEGKHISIVKKTCG